MPFFKGKPGGNSKRRQNSYANNDVPARSKVFRFPAAPKSGEGTSSELTPIYFSRTIAAAAKPKHINVCPPKPFSQFTRFPDIPAELRMIIWTYACYFPRFIHAGWSERYDRVNVYTPAPALIHVNYESREIALKHYTPLYPALQHDPWLRATQRDRPAVFTGCKNEGLNPAGAYINFAVDVVLPTTDGYWSSRKMITELKDFEGLKIAVAGKRPSGSRPPWKDWTQEYLRGGLEKVIFYFEEENLADTENEEKGLISRSRDRSYCQEHEIREMKEVADFNLDRGYSANINNVCRWSGSLNGWFEALAKNLQGEFAETKIKFMMMRRNKSDPWCGQPPGHC